MNYPPPVDLTFGDVPTDPRAKHELLVRIFGSYLAWAFSEASKISKDFVESTEKRKELSPAGQRYYEEISMTLPDEMKPLLYKFGDAELKNFAKIIMVMLTAQGISHRFGDHHAIRFKLIMEIIDVETASVQLEEIINRGGRKSFMHYLDEWLESHASQ
jgi:hypothetical protein